ncbi:IS110 family transposase [Streptomyces sp. NPDC058682]|uniref:IS110 family transposase n=1 Tax=Streptomyces sp. NPDC058682 TaxID=3346596 RepID=UPI003646A8C5
MVSHPKGNACATRRPGRQTHHHCVAIDQGGTKDVLALRDHVTWAVDMAGGEPALLLALVTGHDQDLLFIPGQVVNRASDGYRGEGKTDARDALVIADQARIRRDLKPMRPTDEAIIELKVLTSRRTDLVRDRTRAINRPRSMLTGVLSARLARWLRARGVRTPAELAATAVEAAEQQDTAVPGEAVIAQLVRPLAADVRVLHEKVAEVDR